MITPFRLLALSLAALGLASCQTKNSTNTDPYASNAMAGGYHPYPDQGGYATNTAPAYQQPAAPSYTTPPAPEPPQPDPYAYTAPKTSPSTKSAASTSTKKKTSTTASSTKKKPSSSGKRYTVKQGDTLYGIAHRNGTTVTKLKSANGLTSDLIHPGQTFKIP